MIKPAGCGEARYMYLFTMQFSCMFSTSKNRDIYVYITCIAMERSSFDGAYSSLAENCGVNQAIEAMATTSIPGSTSRYNPEWESWLASGINGLMCRPWFAAIISVCARFHLLRSCGSAYGGDIIIFLWDRDDLVSSVTMQFPKFPTQGVVTWFINDVHGELWYGYSCLRLSIC